MNADAITGEIKRDRKEIIMLIGVTAIVCFLAGVAYGRLVL
jgi:hypothetical protein